jgi:hypothetical protein
MSQNAVLNKGRAATLPTLHEAVLLLLLLLLLGKRLRPASTSAAMAMLMKSGE